jgi:hypothetical protein
MNNPTPRAAGLKVLNIPQQSGSNSFPLNKLPISGASIVKSQSAKGHNLPD